MVGKARPRRCLLSIASATRRDSSTWTEARSTGRGRVSSRFLARGQLSDFLNIGAVGVARTSEEVIMARQSHVKREQIDISRIKLVGIHGMKIGGEVVQMIFADPSDAITFAQRLMPTRGGDKIEIIPIVIAEKIEKEFRR